MKLRRRHGACRAVQTPRSSAHTSRIVGRCGTCVEKQPLPGSKPGTKRRLPISFPPRTRWQPTDNLDRAAVHRPCRSHASRERAAHQNKTSFRSVYSRCGNALPLQIWEIVCARGFGLSRPGTRRVFLSSCARSMLRVRRDIPAAHTRPAQSWHFAHPAAPGRVLAGPIIAARAVPVFCNPSLSPVLGRAVHAHTPESSHTLAPRVLPQLRDPGSPSMSRSESGHAPRGRWASNVPR